MATASTVNQIILNVFLFPCTFFLFLTFIYIDSNNFHSWGNLLASPFNKGTQNNPCILYICVASLFLRSISNPIPETIHFYFFIQCLCCVSSFHYSAGHSPVFMGPNTLTSSNETDFLLSRTFRKHPTKDVRISTPLTFSALTRDRTVNYYALKGL